MYDERSTVGCTLKFKLNIYWVVWLVLFYWCTVCLNVWFMYYNWFKSRCTCVTCGHMYLHLFVNG